MSNAKSAWSEHDPTAAARGEMHKVAATHEAKRAGLSHAALCGDLDGSGDDRIGCRRLAAASGAREAQDFRPDAKLVPGAFHEGADLGLGLFPRLSWQGAAVDHE